MCKTESERVHCVLDPGCASQRMFEAVSGWSPLVVMALKGGGKRRHGELRRELGGVSQKMLIQTLRQLEMNGLVERGVHPVVSPKVEYSLTLLGRSVQPLLEAICQWSERRLPEVEEAPARGRGPLRLRGRRTVAEGPADGRRFEDRGGDRPVERGLLGEGRGGAAGVGGRKYRKST